MSRTISPEDLRKTIETTDHVLVLDVRRKTDYESDPSVVPGAVRHDPEKVDEWSALLPKDKEIIIYCARGGSVSNNVLDQLLARKIDARFIEGGIAAWKASGGKTVKK